MTIHDETSAVPPDGRDPSDGAVQLDLVGTAIGSGRVDDPLDRTPDHHGIEVPDLSPFLSATTPNQDYWAASPYRLVTVADAAQFLTISRSMLYDLVASGQLRKVKIETRTAIPRMCLEEFVRDRLR